MSAKTQPEDAPKHHGPAQKKLLSLEAQRISSILENCISQVEIVATLPAVHGLESVPGVVGKELSGALQEQQTLNVRLETLEGLKQESDGDQEGDLRRAWGQLERDIKNSVRDLLRVVRAHPDAICGLRAELGVGETECILIKELEKFHSHVVETLLTSPDDKLQLVRHMRLSSSPTHDLERIVSQGEDVAAAIMQIDAKISEKNYEIIHLQSSLTESRHEADASLLANKHQSLIETAEKKHTSIQQEIDQLKSQLNSLILKNRPTEREIREKNEKLKTEIEYLLQTFDSEVEETQASLELVGMDYERMEDELRKEEEPFSVLEMECNRIQEKRRLAEEKRREEMRELELKTKAAIFAQAWWRGYSTRKALKNKGKSKKAKKGKGKKTK